MLKLNHKFAIQVAQTNQQQGVKVPPQVNMPQVSQQGVVHNQQQNQIMLGQQNAQMQIPNANMQQQQPNRMQMSVQVIGNNQGNVQGAVSFA